MVIPFYKFQGTGNDFVMVDNRTKFYEPSTERNALLCNRKFGIGADGLILLQNEEGYDFRMVYFNADGRESSMCGNGGRCIAAFAVLLGLAGPEANFVAIDGDHKVKMKFTGSGKWHVSLQMMDVYTYEMDTECIVMNTGSPHYMLFRDHLDQLDVYKEGRLIRYNDEFRRDGINVNFLEMKADGLHVRTYERGVEDETLSCGTGVTASVLSAKIKGLLGDATYCKVHTLGGELGVRFDIFGTMGFQNVWLEGAAEFVFKGEITI